MSICRFVIDGKLSARLTPDAPHCSGSGSVVAFWGWTAGLGFSFREHGRVLWHRRKPVLKVAYQVLLSCLFPFPAGESSWKLSSWSFSKDCLRSFEEISIIISECYQYKPLSQAVLEDFSYCLSAIFCCCCYTEDPSLAFFSLRSSAALRLLGEWAVISILLYFFVLFNQLWVFRHTLVIFGILDCITRFNKANTSNNSNFLFLSVLLCCCISYSCITVLVQYCITSIKIKLC